MVYDVCTYTNPLVKPDPKISQQDPFPEASAPEPKAGLGSSKHQPVVKPGWQVCLIWICPKMAIFQ